MKVNGVIVTVALIFILFLAACKMPKNEKGEAVSRIMLGIMLILLGFVLPIVSKAWILILFLGIFGIFGVIVIVKAINKLMGNEGGELDQAIDEKLNEVGMELVDIAAGTGKSSSPILYIPKIIKGVFTILFGMIFAVFGGFAFKSGEHLGALFFCIGVGICISGICSIKEVIDIKNEGH